MKSAELRQKFLDFFKENGHTIISSASLIPENDPTVLFTTAGMQQFKPYYLGEKSPYGNNVASCQKCMRTSDIEEIGDERHLTFFEMLGNFSFGGYFKEEAIKLAYEFIIKELKIKIDYVTVFEGDKDTPRDEESAKIWGEFGFSEKKDNLKFCARSENFWGPNGGEGPCGPTTEIYINGIEIWNIVFNQYYSKNGKLESLKTPGIDTGMGLERLAMVIQKAPTVFDIDLFEPIIKLIPEEFDEGKKRIIADHSRAINALVADGAKPSNKEQGYVLRRLIRRIVAYEFLSKNNFLDQLIKSEVFTEEKNKFLETLQKGIAEYSKIKDINMEKAFYLYQSFGLPFDILKELNANKTKHLKREDFEEELKKHQELSRTASAGMFKGGLADTGAQTVKYHTATHLLLSSLRQILGNHIFQKGSNITIERLRFDFSHSEKMSLEQIQRVEDLVNQKIKENLSVDCEEMSLEEAKKQEAMGIFGAKYGERVKVYSIGGNPAIAELPFSREICGGPHVKSTGELGRFKIIKEESVSAGVRRIKARLE